MNKFFKKSNPIAFLLIFTMNFQMGPFVSVSAAAYNQMKGGTHIGNVSGTPAPGEPEAGEQPARNNSANCGETDPILMSSGEFTISNQDLCPDQSVMPVKFFRTYRSQRAFNGPLGYGWYYNFYIRLQKLSNNNILMIDGETGRKNEFSYNTYAPNIFYSPNGIYAELVRNTDGTHTLTKPNGTKYNFDIEGKLSSIVDRNNNTMSFTYDPAGKLPIIGRSGYFINISIGLLAMDYRLKTITDAVGRSYQLNYNIDGRISSITDYAGRTWTYAYQNDDLISVTEPDTPQYPSGLTTTYTYDPNHNLETITDPKGQTFVTNHYDTNDRVAFQDLGMGMGTVELSYDTVSRKTAVTDVKGHVSQWTYNTNGNPTQIKYFTEGLRPDDPTGGYTTAMTYDGQMNLYQIIYPKGNGTMYQYHYYAYNPRSRGNLLEIRQKTDMIAGNNNTNDLVTTFTYDTQFNQIKTKTDPKGNITTYTYDYELFPTDLRYGTKGNLVKIEQPLVNGQRPTTWFRYNSRGQITEIQNPNNIITEFTYYPATSYLKEINQDPSGINAVSLITYDPFGYIDTVTDANNHTVDLNFNALGWLIEVMNPLTYKTKYTYDQNKNVTKVERQANAAGTQWQTTNLTYNIFNLIATITDPLNRVTTFGYDNSKNRTSILDHEGNTTTFEYDERELLFKVKDANTPQGITQYDYDENSNIKRITDANGNATNYTYDLFDREQRVTYADGRFSEYEYDKNNNIKRYTTPSTANIDFIYDALNRMTTKQMPTITSTYTYDIGSRLINAENTASQIHFVYDNLNRVDTVTQTIGGASYTLNPSYDKVGNRTQLIYPSGKNVEYVYDINSRLQNIKVNTAVMTQYTYDTLDRRTQRDYSTAPVQRASYTYNMGNEVTLLTNLLVGGSTLSMASYTYDGVGNRISHGTLTQNMAYTYNDIYELKDITGSQNNHYNYDKVNNRVTTDGVSYTKNNLNQYTLVGATTYSYDNNGNLTNDGTNIYTYDAQNRLSTLDTLGTLNDASYTYDAFDRRVSKTVGGVVTRFIYDGDESIEERDNVGTLQADYVFGEGLDEVLTMTRSGNTYYYHTDGLGSVTKITNSVGTVVDSYDYDAYGQTTDTSSINNPYMFTSARFDKESGLYYLRARMYDPKIGRFLQRDPIGYFDSMNLYQYVLNSPTNYIDPFGLWTFQIGTYNSRGFLKGYYDEVGIAISFSWSRGFGARSYRTTGDGLYSGAGASGGLVGAVSNNDSVDDICGESYMTGGSTDLGISIGGDRSQPLSDSKPFYSANLGLGFGYPAESHFFKVTTGDFTWWRR